MIEHCVSAFSKSQREKLYRVYVTDALMVIAKNTDGASEKGNMTARYADLIKPVKEETRTAEDIIDGIKAKLGG